MCGIFAAVGVDITEEARGEVIRLLRHRGPDGDGYYLDRAVPVTLVHTRLAVLDLETGAQPMQSADGSVVLAANGEIYGFEDIRTSLEAKGYGFRTRSDSEVILGLYEEYGLECFAHLRGEFAFIVYDKTRGRVIAARDRFGIKPLYFARAAGGFVFASEMKAIFGSGLVRAKLDVAGLDPLLDQDPESARFPFEGIEHVPPACYVAIDLPTGEMRIERYWSTALPRSSAEPLDAGRAAEEAPAAALAVRRQLEDSVRLRLRADVPVGVYLSGGIDSAFVAALMKRNLDAPLHSFSIAFSGSDRDESKLAQRSAEFVGSVHHQLDATKQSLWANLPDALWHSELPFVSLAPVGKYLLSEEARRHVTVVLTGEGADEVFLGYRSFFRKAIRESRAGESGNVSGARRRLKLSARASRFSLMLFDKRHRRMLAQKRAAADPKPSAATPAIHAVQESRLAAMPLDILCFLGDREEMAHSLEARLPFLDHHLYETAKRLPVDLKMREGVEKAVLRDAALGILPEEIRIRRKSGFMLTSDAVDFFGADQGTTRALRQSYLSRRAFARAGVFSYSTYRLLSLAAQAPRHTGLKSLRRLRRNANKVIMYMMQVHMLQDMFVDNPRWSAPDRERAAGARVGPSKKAAFEPKASAERLIYRMAGLPVALRGLWTRDPDPLRRAFIRRYWRPESLTDVAELVAGIALSPLALPLASLWFTIRNGSLTSQRYGRGIAAQFADQLKLYVSDGVLPPWYYIFRLHEDRSRAGTYIHRFETKPCYFPLLKRRRGSPLNDKEKFAQFAAAHGIPCAPTRVVLRGERPVGSLPQQDLFVKKVVGRGGRGAERWDFVNGRFQNMEGLRLSVEELIDRLVSRSRKTPLLVQPRMKPHGELRPITAGALPTVRVLTCLDERQAPEVVAAMFRTSIGSNATVDNLHAGGIGALVDLQTGALSKSSNLGSHARLGWFSCHPDTDAPIEGRILPRWEEAKQLALQAHSQFADRIVVGWDVAILDDGPIIIEGNGNPDLDILQRFMTQGFRNHRFGELLGHHLERVV